MELLSQTFTFFYPMKGEGVVIPEMTSDNDFKIETKIYDVPGILPELLDQPFYLYLKSREVSKMYDKLFLYQNAVPLNHTDPLRRSNSI